MPGTGRHNWYFVGKPPMIFRIVATLLFTNVFLSLILSLFAQKLIPRGLPNAQLCPAMASYGIQYGVPRWLCWYANWDIAITFVLLGMGALIMFLFRKNVAYVDMHQRRGPKRGRGGGA